MIDWAGIGSNLAGDSIKEVVGQLDSAAKLTLSTLYPKEFEVYMLSLELVDYNDNSLYYFTFPINPESISKSQPQIKQIDATHGAVVVNKSGRWVPQDLVLRGNFGRQFKFVTNVQGEVSFAAVANKVPNRTEFSMFYKSGYGCLKILQEICEQSNMMDGGYARKLYLHNLALGESYLVEVVNFQASQTIATNMLWGYDLRLKIVSNIFDRSGQKTLAKRLVTSAVTSAANSVASSAKSIVDGITL